MGVFTIGEALAMAGANGGGRPFGGGGSPRRPRVRAGSRPKGLCEQGFWTAFDPRAGGRLMLAAERYDRRGRGKGRRNGPLGHIALELLRALIRRVDHRTGRLDPALTTLMRDIGRSRGAIVAAMKALRTHGFLHWLRRYEPIAGDGPGPRIRQASNAYRLTLPGQARHLLGRLIPPPPVGHEPQDPTAAPPASPLAKALRRLALALAERESSRRPETSQSHI